MNKSIGEKVDEMASKLDQSLQQDSFRQDAITVLLSDGESSRKLLLELDQKLQEAREQTGVSPYLQNKNKKLSETY
jgi:superfamily I DNA and RNA helicase